MPTQNAIFSNSKQSTATVSIDDLYAVVRGLFREPIIGPLKFKMAEIHRLENHKIAIISERKYIRFWWTLVHKCRSGTRWQSRDQIWKFWKFKFLTIAQQPIVRFQLNFAWEVAWNPALYSAYCYWVVGGIQRRISGYVESSFSQNFGIGQILTFHRTYVFKRLTLF